MGFESLEQRAMLSADPGWAFGLGGPVFLTDVADAVVNIGPDDNLYVAGSFRSTVDFDPGPGVAQLTTNQNAQDGFIAKYTPQGSFLWVKQFGQAIAPVGVGNEFSTGIEFDAAGNVYVSGWTDAAAPKFGSTTLTGQGSFDAFVTKLDAAGNFLWTRGVGGVGDDRANALSVSAAGDVYVTGSFRETVDFDPSPSATFTMTAGGGAGAADAFVWKLDTQGNFAWARQFSGPADEFGHRVVAGNDGSVYAAGTFRDTTDFGEPGDPLLVTGATPGVAAMYVAQLEESTGNTVWAEQIGGTGAVTAARLAADGAGHIYVAGRFEEAASFGVGGPSLVSAGGQDGFVSQWDTVGNVIWAEQVASGAGNVLPGELHLAADGSLVLGYGFEGVADFDPGAGAVNLTSVDGMDGAVFKLNSDGSLGWVRHVAGPGPTWTDDVVTDSIGNVYVTGFYEYSVTLPTGHVITNPGTGLTYHPGNGQFLMKLALGDPPPAADKLYFSILNNATVGGVAAANEDILALDVNGAVGKLLDGSDVGLSSLTLAGFDQIATNQFLMSFTAAASIPGVGTVDDSDLVLFNASSLGENTGGTFSMYFDGSDVGLTTSNERLDAVHRLDDGRLVISAAGSASVSGASGGGEDMLVFTPSSLGANTAGSWAVYFDGSDVGLSGTNENVDAAAIGGDGKIYLSTTGNFSVSGSTGTNEDVFAFTPTQLGGSTSGSYTPGLFFDGSAWGLAGNDVTGIDIPAAGFAPLNSLTVGAAGAAAAGREVEPAPVKKSSALLAREQAFASFVAVRATAPLRAAVLSAPADQESAPGASGRTGDRLATLDLAFERTLVARFN